MGNPYEGCRPECVVDTDCPSTLSCIRSKCQNPCPGTCGTNTECRVINHRPACTCIQGYTGNPFQYCTPIPQIGMNKYTTISFSDEVSSQEILCILSKLWGKKRSWFFLFLTISRNIFSRCKTNIKILQKMKRKIRIRATLHLADQTVNVSS